MNAVVSVAISQIGIKENPAGSNKVKYNTWYYKREVSGAAFPWCAVFIAWCFNEAGQYEFIKGVQYKESCLSWMQWAMKQGKWTNTPKAGYLVLFDWGNDERPDHIGIIEKVIDKNTIMTIEGNTSYSNNSNGGEVMRRIRSVSSVLGYINVFGEKEKEEKPVTVNVELSVLKYGSKGEEVKTIQRLLNAVDKAGLVVDGDFGNNTRVAVTVYQSKNKLEIDGIVGAKTWESLLK